MDDYYLPFGEEQQIPFLDITNSNSYASVGDTKAIFISNSSTCVLNFLNESTERIPFKETTYFTTLSREENLVCFVPSRSAPVMYNLDNLKTTTLVHRGLDYGTTFPVFTLDDEKIILGTDSEKPDFIWNVETNQKILELPGHKRLTSGIAINEESNIVITVSWDKVIFIMDSRTGEVIHKIPDAHRNYMKSVVITQNNDFYTTANDRILKQWDIRTFENLFSSTPDPDVYTQARYTRHNKLIQLSDNRMQVRDLSDETKPVIWNKAKKICISQSGDNAIIFQKENWRLWKCSESRSRAKSARSIL